MGIHKNKTVQNWTPFFSFLSSHRLFISRLETDVRMKKKRIEEKKAALAAKFFVPRVSYAIHDN